MYTAIYFGIFIDCYEWGIEFDQTDIKQRMAKKQWFNQYFSRLGGCGSIEATPYDSSFDIVDTSDVPFKSSLEFSYITKVDLDP